MFYRVHAKQNPPTFNGNNLLRQELNINLRNSTEVLNLYKKFPLKPTDGKNESSQWISLILH